MGGGGSTFSLTTVNARCFDTQVTMQLRRDGFPALAIHGDKSQGERDWVLAEFKSGKAPIMLATDVAARGLGTGPVCV